MLGWYLCRYEHARAYNALLSRIAAPLVVVSDGGTGFAKALRKTWPGTRHQRCIFHVFCQVKRYTTSRPKTAAGVELYGLARELLHLENQKEVETWVHHFLDWKEKYRKFLSQMTRDEDGRYMPTHERLLKAHNSLLKLLREGTMFTYLDKALLQKTGKIPTTNNPIEGGVNARLRAMLRDHRGLNIERRIKVVFWWCYVHLPEPLSAAEIIKMMPTDRSITDIYNRLTAQKKGDGRLLSFGQSVVWSELHRTSSYPALWNWPPTLFVL